MKRVKMLLICFCSLFCVNGCKDTTEDNHIPDDFSVSKYSEATSKYYEELTNGYKAAFYEKSEITIEKISNWLASCEASDRYYHYIYSDPDSWDMFIYYAPENDDFHGSSIKFSIEGSLLKVYVTNDNSINTSAEYILIRIQAPMRGNWPNSSELYLDGIKVEMHDDQ